MKKPKDILPKTVEEITRSEAQIEELSKRTEFCPTEYSVELLANKMRTGDFVAPAYQRKYSWEHGRKSRFIESMVLGFPIPLLFFCEMKDGRLEIIDGFQRLRSIEEFLLGDMRLGRLDGLTALSGFRFADLPKPRQRKIRKHPMYGIVLSENVHEQTRFDVFERINTGGRIGNMQEVRRETLEGAFTDLIIELAILPNFEVLAPVSAMGHGRWEREELVARFFAYTDGLDGYRDRPSEFIFNYVKNMNIEMGKSPALINLYRVRFHETINFIGRVFPYGFRKNRKGKATRRARFEAIAVGSRLALDVRPALVNEDVANVLPWLTSDDFTMVTSSDGANAIARLKERTRFVRDRLLRV
ncbi:DUF262 domain-containing protein [Burkholderia sp. Ac-20353]|uniref:DUF262 domain-containing protein n=1 Tax=Burkholderia sp. Ac-20353 TaxID=2703894 RepID=UPI00197C16F0|nr:DUF262 domain-containing protein [Burkholderia sp. Ac-20353]MBN3787673.1 DUF262 domain-containing protein [Burkholderia sp. Ac-20353]